MVNYKSMAEIVPIFLHRCLISSLPFHILPKILNKSRLNFFNFDTG